MTQKLAVIKSLHGLKTKLRNITEKEKAFKDSKTMQVIIFFYDGFTIFKAS